MQTTANEAAKKKEELLAIVQLQEDEAKMAEQRLEYVETRIGACDDSRRRDWNSMIKKLKRATQIKRKMTVEEAGGAEASPAKAEPNAEAEAKGPKPKPKAKAEPKAQNPKPKAQKPKPKAKAESKEITVEEKQAEEAKLAEWKD